MKILFIQTIHVFIEQTGSAKRLGSDADRPAVSGTGVSAVGSNGPKQTNGPSVREITQVRFL